MEGAASYYLRHRVPVFLSEGAWTEALYVRPNTVVLVADPRSEGMLKLKDVMQLSYGNIRYHYFTGS